MRDPAAAKTAFGAYVTPVAGDVGSASALTMALKGVRAVVIPGRTGQVPRLAAQAGVEHIVLLSSAGGCNMCMHAPQCEYDQIAACSGLTDRTPVQQPPVGVVCIFDVSNRHDFVVRCAGNAQPAGFSLGSLFGGQQQTLRYTF